VDINEDEMRPNDGTGDTACTDKRRISDIITRR
jgi:hypothetical protein